MRNVNDQQFAAIVALPGPERFEHFVGHVADTGEVWGLKGADGWCMTAADDGSPLMPVWPHPRYAEACAIGEWADSQPAAIPLGQWMEKWLPGMETDGISVAVFPTPAGAGIVISPRELQDELSEGLIDLE